MKSIVCLFAILLLSCASTPRSTSADRVYGNGKITTKEIKISDFETISLGAGINRDNGKGKKSSPVFHYTQSKGKSSLKVTTDSNILPLLEIHSSNGQLSIRTRDRQARLFPTRLTIEGQSGKLSQVEITGSMDFHLKNNLKGDRLKIRITGSGDAHLEQNVTLEEYEMSISGSGDIIASKLKTDDVRCKVSGSGDINLAGKARSGSYHVSGSGDISAYNMEVRDLECSVSGSGDIKAYATQTFKANVSGSGDIRYKGDAQANTRKTGSGTIRRDD